MNNHEWKASTLIPAVSDTGARQLRQTVVMMLGLVLMTTCVLGQDRIRIVESPRTAMREKRPVGQQSPPRAAQPERGGVPNPVPSVVTEHFVTEMQDQYRTVYVPVVESQTEPTTAWWNPLGFSPRTFQPRPVVRWEQRVEKIRVPIRYRELVTEPTELSQPSRSASPANRSAARGAANNGARGTDRSAWGLRQGATVTMPAQQFGGISRLESDQPRFGTRPGLQEPRVIR